MEAQIPQVLCMIPDDGLTMGRRSNKRGGRECAGWRGLISTHRSSHLNDF